MQGPLCWKRILRLYMNTIQQAASFMSLEIGNNAFISSPLPG